LLHFYEIIEVSDTSREINDNVNYNLSIWVTNYDPCLVIMIIINYD